MAEHEAATEEARAHYMYRQSIVFEEFDRKGSVTGWYREARDVIFSPTGERTEQIVEPPRNTLRSLRLTEQDFRDIREVHSLLLTPDQLWNYDTRIRGDEKADGIECKMLEVRPRQILTGQRLFEGLLWVDPRDYSVVKLEGQPVPQVRTTRHENLFPHFTTLRGRVGEYWFPIHTFADDTLYFRTGPQRVRLTIRYSNYKRFGAESEIKAVP
ncbi:MAG TPA: hypothetical protein VFL57_02520 [Bryobacteraceae bacterium]|nr:hypothetical protein [Bryobacteraceae bacterium]